MNYKEIIKDRSLRLKLLRMLSFIPDRTMIKIQYRIKTGHRLNLKNPRRFTEKLQWYKLFYRNYLMVQCVDKYDVREYVRIKGLEEILLPCYGIYNSPNEIYWDELPDQFVIKDTLGCGGNEVRIIKEKKAEDFDQLNNMTSEWVLSDHRKKDGGREWPYYNGKKHRIIIEKYIDPDPYRNGLLKYKSFTVDGIQKWFYLIDNREVNIQKGNKAINDINNGENNTINKMLRTIDDDSNYYFVLQAVARQLSSDNAEAQIILCEKDGEIMIGDILVSGSKVDVVDQIENEMKDDNMVFLPKAIRSSCKEIGKIFVSQKELQMNKHGLMDYKFFCFNGKIQFMYVMGDRELGKKVSVGIYDPNFKKIPVIRCGDSDVESVAFPWNFNKMKQFAEMLAADFPHVRVDLFSICDKVYFGELTFFNASGYMKYDPDTFDYYIGDFFQLPTQHGYLAKKQ